MGPQLVAPSNCAIMAEVQMGASEIDDARLRQHFDDLDKDRSGTLDKDEVKEALKHAGKYAGEAQLQQLFEIVDKDKSGHIDFEEFKILMSLPDEDPHELLRCALAEFLGVLLFQFFGGLHNAGAAGNGVILAVLIYCTCNISGGHLNPAVSFACCITRQITVKKFFVYIFSQFCGGLVGAACYKALDPASLYPSEYTIPADGGWTNAHKFPSCTLPCGGSLYAKPRGAPVSACSMDAGHIFGFEFIATFLLVFTVFGAAVDPKSGAGTLAPIPIGFSLFVAALSIGSHTGAGLNPARTLCPAVVFNCWHVDAYGDTKQWMYVIAQTCGAACAGLIYMFVFLSRPDDSSKAASNHFKFMALETNAVRKRLDAKKKTE